MADTCERMLDGSWNCCCGVEKKDEIVLYESSALLL